MSEYKRLTKQAGWHKDIDLKDELGYSYIYQRLSELENKIEQGTLIELPCKVGDMMWEANKNYIAPWDFVVDKIEILENNYIRILDKYENNYDMEELGKTLFLTREEAEKRLKELQDA